MGYSPMDQSLHDLGPNFEGPGWNKNCQLCGREVEVGQIFYSCPAELVTTPSAYPIVHAGCLQDHNDKA